VKEKKWAFLATMIVGVAIFLVILIAGPVYQLATTGWEDSMDYMFAVGGGIVWLVLQIPVIFFSFKAYRKL
jgi:cytochrome c oxidase assembly factor CtaG